MMENNRVLFITHYTVPSLDYLNTLRQFGLPTFNLLVFILFHYYLLSVIVVGTSTSAGGRVSKLKHY